MPLLVYTAKVTPRLKYIFYTLFSSIGVDLEFTSDQTAYDNHSGAKLNYSPHSITNNEVWIEPGVLLYQTGISDQPIECFNRNDSKAFFKTVVGDFPFDLFAASFYLLSRYEEYLPHKLDFYGRYSHENSLAFKERFLHLPLVNIWLMEFSKLLQQKFPSLPVKPTSFHFLPTYDIDIAWSYRGKGWMRNAGGMFRSIVNGEWLMVKKQAEVWLGRQPDPFDIYDRLNKLHSKCCIEPVYFFLLAKTIKGYDKNVPPSSPALQKLVNEHASKYMVGIHPSWQSAEDVNVLHEEVKTLQEITGNDVRNSRQHYIRMSLPITYQRLIGAGILNDFSMGYGSINGFRASYCLPYKWYDLVEEKTTDLLVYPFCYMEANSFYEQHYTLQQASDELEQYYNVIKAVNGTFITIFHNHLLGNKQLFDGWMEMYEKFVRRITTPY